jgi:prolyl 4-hydroxylase
MMLDGNVRLLCCCLILICRAGHAESQNEGSYDCFADFSWAIRTPQLSNPDRQAVYDEFITNCHEAAGDTAHQECVVGEAARLQLNTFQPQSVYNFTSTGFTKRRVPDELRTLLQGFWDRNSENGVVEWGRATPYHNSWDTEPKIIHVSHPTLGGGAELVAAIGDAVKPVLEEWTGMQQSVISVYGIRIYYNNSILTPHVDRLPLVASAIINIAQDVDTPWVLEVYDHDGIAHNVTMEPWDMVLYESHSVLHGRPFALDGKFYANVFVHFEPTVPLVLSDAAPSRTMNDLPLYLIPGTHLEDEWRHANPDGWDLLKDATRLSQKGDIVAMRYLAWLNPSSLRVADEQGWQPIHAAAKYGQLDILQFLMQEQGISSETPTFAAETPLVIAQENLPEGHPVIDYLSKVAAFHIYDKRSPDHDEAIGRCDDSPQGIQAEL